MSDIEKQNKVTCSVEDVENVRQYSKHFGVELTDDLVKALDLFEKEQSFENQKEFKLQVSKWILESEHESFKDDLWNAPKKAAQDAVFELQFDKDLNEHLSTDKVDGNTDI